MTPEERQRMNELCRKIQDEKDPPTFSKLIQELSDLLECKEKRLEETPKSGK